MTTKFETIVASIKATLDAELGVGTIRFKTGEKSRHQHSAPNEVVWVSESGDFGPAPSGPKPYFQSSSEVSGSALATRNLNVETDVWGRNDEEAEALLECVVRAAYLTLSFGGFSVLDYTIVTETREGAGQVNNGTKIRLRCQFHVPLLKEFDVGLATILNQGHSGSFDGSAQCEPPAP